MLHGYVTCPGTLRVLRVCSFTIGATEPIMTNFAFLHPLAGQQSSVLRFALEHVQHGGVSSGVSS
jgi:hypothetical protein